MPESTLDFATIVPTGTEPKITSIFDFTAEALEQLAFWFEQRGLHIPVSQVLGFKQYTAAFQQVNGSQSTTSTTYSTSSGPSLTGLSNGSYLVQVGAVASTSVAGVSAAFAARFNAASVDDNVQAATSKAVDEISISKAMTATLSSGNNTIDTVIKSSSAGTTVTLLNRWVLALKYAEL